MLPVQVSMDVTSLYTNIPQEEGITIICKAYETFYRNEPPIPSQYLADMLRLILKDSLSIRPSSGARGEEILDGGGGKGRRERKA